MIQTLSDALEHRGYTKLTPVQEAVTNPELQDADLLVSAQTGSGKTVGFGLAIAPTLLDDKFKFDRAGKPLALIIAPTRELALQVKRELAWLYEKAGVVMASCVGGMDMREERRILDKGAHIVVATPGRLRDHIMRNSLKMTDLRAIVLDEADEMLDLGFKDDLEFILSKAPDERRTLMFSATVPRSIANLAKSYQKDAVRVVTKAEESQHTDIEYRAMNVSARDGENAIINVLRYYEAPNALVFCNTRVMVNRLTTRLSNRGFSVVALSGELSQNERTHALQAMRDGRARVCVATDVAARGIDLPNLDLVVHAELPQSHETLLHRSGRTGRAGRKGVSALIVQGKSRRKAERILQGAKVKADWCDAPSAESVIARDEERLMADPIWEQQITAKQTAAAQKLIDLHSPEKIAAAYLKLYTSRQSAPEELSASGVDGAPKKRADFGATVWFSLSGGREQNAEPRRLLPMLCKAGGITKDDIGAIRVQQKESFIEIKKSSVAEFVKTIGPNLRVEDDAVLTQLKKPPSIANSPRPSFSDRQRDRKPSGNSDRGNKRKPARKPEADHTDFADQNVSKKKPKKDKKPKKSREKSKGTPYSKDSWAKEMERLEGAVTEIKPKAASGGDKPWDKKPKSKAGSSNSPSASKRGKEFSKGKKKP